MLQNAYLGAKIGFDAEENEPSKVWSFCLRIGVNSVSNLSTKSWTRRFRGVPRSFSAARAAAPRKLPGLLHQRGWQIERLKPIPVLGDAASMAGQWMERFVLVFGQQLQQVGHWNADDALEAKDEIARAHADPGCYWVGPTVLEVMARRP